MVVFVAVEVTVLHIVVVGHLVVHNEFFTSLVFVLITIVIIIKIDHYSDVVSRGSRQQVFVVVVVAGLGQKEWFSLIPASNKLLSCLWKVVMEGGIEVEWL